MHPQHISRNLLNLKPIKEPNLQDPRLMYKAGQPPAYVHNVDAAGWLAQGWTHEQVQEASALVNPEPIAEVPALEKPKAKPKAEKVNEQG